MKKHTLMVAGVAAALLSSQAIAQSGDGPWMVRARATYLSTDTSSTSGLGGALPADAIDVNSKWIPEVDVSYFFTPNIAVELVLTIPQKHEVTVNALSLGKIGTFKHLPPTLLAQYHFTGLGALKPYVGAGVNYTILSSEKMSVGTDKVTIENSSIGPAIQVGADYRLNRNWYLNVDVKKVWIGTDVFLAGAKISELKVDPWLFSIGVGYRF